MKKTFIIIVLIILVPIAFFVIKNQIDKYYFEKSWLIEVTSEYINVRKTPDLYEYNPLGKINKGEKYKVIEIKLDHAKYVWYKIEWEKREAWIASERNNPSVVEINNPEYKEGSYEVDYARPIVKVYENHIETESIATINYDHLEISDDSEYKITHKVYLEDCNDYHQYWIQYTVTDSFGNSRSKMQGISFEIEPKPEEVNNLSEIRNSVCEEKATFDDFKENDDNENFGGE